MSTSPEISVRRGDCRCCRSRPRRSSRRRAAGSRVAPDLYSRLPWRHIGPEGNRISAVAGVPGDPLVYYAGSASGGIAKTTDGGITWEQIFDDQPVHSIGDIAVAPSDPEHRLGGHRRGVHPQPHLGRRRHLQVHRCRPDVGAHGSRADRPHRQASSSTRRTRTSCSPARSATPTARSRSAACSARPTAARTGSACCSWTRTPAAPSSTWIRATRASSSRACGSSTSRRGAARAAARAAACSRRTTAARRGRACAAAGCRRARSARSRWRSRRRIPNRVYAMIETGDGIPWKGKETDRGQVWRSEDGGENWRVVSYDRNAMGRAHYYSHIFVAPDNENETYFLTAGYSVSLDGGETLVQQPGPRAPGGDHHDMWIDPHQRQPDDRRPRSGLLDLAEPRPHLVPQSAAERADVPRHRGQPDPVQRATATSRTARRTAGRATAASADSAAAAAAIPRSMWHTVAGGESGWATPDPVDPNLIWSSASGSGSVGGIVAIYEENRRQARNVEVWPEQANGVARRPALPLQLDDAAHDVAARSQHGVRRQPARAPHDQPRPELGGHQPGSVDQRQERASSSPAASPATTSASSTPSSSWRSRSRGWRRA